MLGHLDRYIFHELLSLDSFLTLLVIYNSGKTWW